MTANAGRSDQGPYRAYAAEEAVTGEGVSLELPVASIGSRVVSGVVDVITYGLLVWGLLWIATSLTDASSQAVQTTAVIVVLVGVLVLLPATLETVTRGRTLGKRIMRLRVVRDDGGPVGFRHALTRALVGWPEIYLLTGVPAAISALSSSRSKRLGDLAAGTYVVTERTTLTLPGPPRMPADLAGWARSADIAALDPGLSTALRQFLARSASLTPGPREALAQQLVSRVLASVAPLPPPGHHPESVLRAVAAERFRRDLERLNREQRLRERVLPRQR